MQPLPCWEPLQSPWRQPSQPPPSLFPHFQRAALPACRGTTRSESRGTLEASTIFRASGEGSLDSQKWNPPKITLMVLLDSNLSGPILQMGRTQAAREAAYRV